MQYGIPAYRLGQIVFGIAAKKQNMAFYCCETDVFDRYRSRLKNLNCGKSCIRFHQASDIPLDVIFDIVRDVARKHNVR